MTTALLIASLAVLPADRLAMADRLFNKGMYAEAAVEYAALKGEKTVSEDELLYRFAECDNALGKTASARGFYAAISARHPHSKHAPRARFMYALGSEGAERVRGLSALDSPSVPTGIRTAALYHLGSDSSDAALLEKCVSLDPDGPYAMYASLKRATILSSSEDAGVRRKGLELLLSVAFGAQGDIAEEALYLAGVQSYREKRYGEAGSLFRRYLGKYADGKRAATVAVMSAWSDYLCARYADAAAACGEKPGDDYDYLRAACAYALGEDEKALALFKKYLEAHPAGKYRADAELPVARIAFKAAEESGDKAAALESAKRAVAVSGLPADRLRLAWAYENAGKDEEACAQYLKIARENPKSAEAAEALYRKAMMDAREERWAGAEIALAEALAVGKAPGREATMLYWRAIASMRLGHEAQAVAFLKDALKRNLSLDESREARLMIADHDLREGRTDEAKSAYEKLVGEGAVERMSASKTLEVGRLLGGEAARKCAISLVAGASPEWRQAGYVLLGETEEAAGSYTAAMDAYRKAMAEKANIADVARAALNLGALEARSGERGKAEETLKKAVALNAADAARRGEAYMLLAENALAKGDMKSAAAYATVVTALYSDAGLLKRAESVIARSAATGERSE